METTPIDHKRWYDAAHSRVSTRVFEGAPNDSELERLKLLASALNGDGIRIVLHEATDKLFSGLLARNIKGVTHFAAMISDEEKSLARVGYKGEAFVLEATAMGLATCWLGGTFKQKEACRLAGLGEGETLAYIIPFGKPSQPISEIPDTDRKRKDLSKLVKTVKGGSLADIEPWQNTALKCARIAPSAMNLQPWRFACAPAVICMVAAGLFSSNADLELGIAMMHIDLGAAVSNVRGTWTKDNTVWVFTAAGANA